MRRGLRRNRVGEPGVVSEGVVATATQELVPPPATDAAASVWESVRQLLEASLPEATFRMWLDPITAVGDIRRRTLTVHGPETVRKWVELRYSELIDSAAREVSEAVDGVRWWSS